MCHDARESFSALVDVSGTAEERARCLAHVAGCADCARELERFRATVALLRAVEPVRAPAAFVDRVLEAASPRSRRRRVLERAFFPLQWKLPIEAAAVVIVGVLVGYLFRQSPEPEQAPRHDAARPAVSDVAPPVAPAPALVPRTEERRAVSQYERKAAAAPPKSLDAAGPVESASPPAGKEEFRGRESAPALERQLEKEVAGARATADVRAKLASPDADVRGILAVKDREAARRQLDELVGKLGGHLERPDPGAAVIQILLPRAAYPELAQGLVRIGSWTIQHESAELPDPVRVNVTVN